MDRTQRLRWQQRCHRLITVQVALWMRPPARVLLCERDCNRWADVYHHPDYTYPDQVVPLCNLCHHRWHARNEPVYPDKPIYEKGMTQHG